MPRAPDGVVYHETLRQRSPVMCAGGCQGRDAIALAHEDYGLTFVVAGKWFAFRELAQFDTRLQIGSG